MGTLTQFRRNFNKQKVVGLLNISSLSLGIMVSVIIGLWAMNELSFDNFHPGHERMYRMLVKAKLNGVEARAATSEPYMGDLALERLPEVEDMARIIFEIGNKTVSIDDVTYTDVDLVVATSNFFNFFNFPLKEGNPMTSFAHPDNVIISESAADKYFPGQDPMGKTMIVDGETFAVSGIMYDAPSNSHLQPEMVFSFASNWKEVGDTYSTYLLLSESSDPAKIAEAVTEITYERSPFYKELGAVVEFEPLKDIHFSDTSIYDPAIKGNKGIVRTFMLVAIIILIISCINFVNLFVSTSFLRTKSIGVKKAYGANRGSLMVAFYGETALYVLVSMVMGLFLAAACIPIFNSLVHANITLDFASPEFRLFVVGLALLIIVVAGSFPAFYMTRFGIIETLKDKFKGKKMSYLQKGFLVLQFSASVFLLIVVTFFGRQVNHMLDVDLGFNRENILYVKAVSGFGQDNYSSLREELLREPSITDITMSTGNPTLWSGGMPVRQNANEADIMVERVGVAPNYFDFMGIKFLEGGNPFRDDAPGSLDVVINESAARILSLGDEKVGRQISSSEFFGENRLTIGGVIKNARTRSLHTEMDPQVYVNMQYGNNFRHLYFKVSGDPKKAISVIEDKWKSSVSGKTPFKYEFLDETYASLYRQETDSRNVLAWALLITLIITVAGLFAMSYYSMQRRVKEIGIRKINGAIISDLILLLNKDMLILLGISFTLGAIVSWLFLHEWLNGFTERTPLSIWVFILTGVVMCTIALATVSWQTWRTATANPVKSLKSE